MGRVWISWLFCISMLVGQVLGVAAEETGLGVRQTTSTNATGPIIVSRAGWQAKQSLPGMKAQDVVGVVLHHTGVRKNPKTSLENKMRGLQAFSQRAGLVSPGQSKPAWPDVPYHFYVDASGRIAEGRDVQFAGDTNTNYDTNGFIQVVIEGDFEKEFPGQPQLVALRDLLVWLAIKWDVPVQQISVHNKHAPTDCPGRHFLALLPTVLKQVAEQRGKSAN